MSDKALHLTEGISRIAACLCAITLCLLNIFEAERTLVPLLCVLMILSGVIMIAANVQIFRRNSRKKK